MTKKEFLINFVLARMSMLDKSSKYDSAINGAIGAWDMLIKTGEDKCPECWENEIDDPYNCCLRCVKK